MTVPSNKIIEGINRKNVLSYKYLYDNYYVALCSYASKFLGEGAEEDVVQDIFMKVWEREGVFADMDSLVAYLYRAVHNACLLKIRDNRELLGKNLEIVGVGLEYESPDNERLLIKEEFYRQLYLIIHSLSPQRKAIIMLSLQGKKVEEIALELGVSANTIKTLKKKIYALLREQLPREAWILFCLFHLFYKF